MKLDQHLDLLESTAETLSTLSFSHSRAFVNSLLSRTEITSVIRDAEPHERALFQTSSKGSPKKIKYHLIASLNRCLFPESVDR